MEMDLYMLVTLATIAYKSFRMVSSVDSIVYCLCVVHECVAYSFGLNISTGLHSTVNFSLYSEIFAILQEVIVLYKN